VQLHFESLAQGRALCAREASNGVPFCVLMRELGSNQWELVGDHPPARAACDACDGQSRLDGVPAGVTPPSSLEMEGSVDVGPRGM